MIVFTWEKSGGFGSRNLKNYDNTSKLVLPFCWKIAFTQTYFNNKNNIFMVLFFSEEFLLSRPRVKGERVLHVEQ